MWIFLEGKVQEILQFMTKFSKVNRETMMLVNTTERFRSVISRAEEKVVDDWTERVRNLAFAVGGNLKCTLDSTVMSLSNLSRYTVSIFSS